MDEFIPAPAGMRTIVVARETGAARMYATVGWDVDRDTPDGRVKPLRTLVGGAHGVITVPVNDFKRIVFAVYPGQRRLTAGQLCDIMGFETLSVQEKRLKEDVARMLLEWDV